MAGIKELIKTKGIKQKWLAQKLGVSEVSVSNWAQGKAVPKAHHLKKLSEILNVPIEYLR